MTSKLIELHDAGSLAPTSLEHTRNFKLVLVHVSVGRTAGRHACEVIDGKLADIGIIVPIKLVSNSAISLHKHAPREQHGATVCHTPH
jgi:hypothetical protein